jgi:pimeloyl-ACP methyl ester carboxylesterase
VFASGYPGRVERLIILNGPHPSIFLRELSTNPAQVEASQYERAFYAASPPYPPWYNYYRADPIKVPRSVAESADARPLVGVLRQRRKAASCHFVAVEQADDGDLRDERLYDANWIARWSRTVRPRFDDCADR